MAVAERPSVALPAPVTESDRGTIDDVIDAARALAWWSHCNLSSPTLYAARRESFTRLRETLRATFHTDLDVETAFVIRAARRLAACSDSNRWGEPYYERKEAFAQLRGALAVMDGVPSFGVDRASAERGMSPWTGTGRSDGPSEPQSTSSSVAHRVGRSIRSVVPAR